MSSDRPGPSGASHLMAPGQMSNAWVSILFCGGMGGAIVLLYFVAAGWPAAVGDGDEEALTAARRDLVEAVDARITAVERHAAAVAKLNELRGSAAVDAALVSRAEEAEAAAKQALEAARRTESDALDRLHRTEKQPAVDFPSEREILVMVILLGALGGTLHLLSSLAVYLGKRELERSWVFHYVLLPVRGAGLAPIVYLLLRVGVLSPGATVEGTTNLNLPAIYALAGLTGMFAKSATDKLAEVFKTLFRTASEPAADSPSDGTRRDPERPKIP